MSNSTNIQTARSHSSTGSECECKTCFDYPQYCKLHQCWQDDPKHQYEYPACEQNMENRTCPDCGQSFIQNDKD